MKKFVDDALAVFVIVAVLLAVCFIAEPRQCMTDMECEQMHGGE